ncbi:membrane protein [Philodulcilactobacillus myokoensis]|uniref:Membrane protein n=1 Tax=Philodulcilactobacillus myokoensis TaxID=2929573 RepID=A0A9W6B1I6_9LACO|nr:PDZ domain-containing protein [Philodulcilactobacillus myokoensis]GLB47142.1 membrane protein [Philodulcilactobacillus myokoensis]
MMKLLTAFGFIFLQPVLWIGIIRTFLNSKNRIKQNRNQFRTAIFSHHYELKNLVINFIILGMILSIISAVIGLTLPLSWVIGYEIILLVSLVIIPWNVFPITISIGTLIGFILFHLNLNLTTKINLPFNMNWRLSNEANALFFVALLLFATWMFFNFTGGNYNTPKIYRNRRNVRIAGYPFKELSIIPMFTLIPGTWVHLVIPFWPILNFNGHTFSFMFLPVIVGLKLTIFNDVPKHEMKALSKRILKLCFFSVVLAIISCFYPIVTIYSLILIGLVYWIMILNTMHNNHPGNSIYSEVINGVRIVGIKPHSPASKMNIEIGDVILDVNHLKVNNENSFYEALLKHPTYCHLRVLDRNNRIKLTSTAIYNNSPHELGIVIFENHHN